MISVTGELAHDCYKSLVLLSGTIIRRLGLLGICCTEGVTFVIKCI